MTLAGGRVLVQRKHGGIGLSHYRAVSVVGPDLMLMSTKGLAVLNGSTSEIGSIVQAQRIQDEKDWMNSDCHMATDSVLGATFCLGGDYPGVTTDEEAGDGCMVVWHDSKCLSMLVGMSQFVACSTGPDPRTGGGDRAQFITSDGVVVVPHRDLTAYPTMLGVTGTVNGTTTSAGSSAIIDSAATFGDTAVGARVYCVDEDNATYAVYAVTAKASATELTVTDLDGNVVSIANGTMYTVSPIPFRVTAPPLGTDFERVKLSNATLCCASSEHSGSTPDTALFRLSGHTGSSGRRLSQDIGTNGSVYAMKDMGRLPENTCASLQIAGPRITLQVEAVCSGARFEVTGLKATQSVTNSVRSADI